MSKFFGRLVGGYNPVDQLIAINIKEIEFPKNPSGKEWLPNMKSLYVGLKRKDRLITSESIPIEKDMKSPIQIGDLLSMTSVFYVDKKKVQKKEL